MIGVIADVFMLVAKLVVAVKIDGHEMLQLLTTVTVMVMKKVWFWW